MMTKTRKWFGWLLLSAGWCSFGYTEQRRDAPAVLDPVATKNAQWAVGEVVAKGSIIPRNKYDATIERHFLGITREGYYRVQEFYVDLGSPFSYKKYSQGTVYSAPYNLINKEDVTHFNSDYDPEHQRNLSIEGAYSHFWDNGHLDFTGQYKQGKKVGYWYFYTGDEVYCIEYYKKGLLINRKRMNVH